MAKITYFERQIIESGIRTHKSKRAIAKALGRDHRVIAREVKRNSNADGSYSAISAQQMANHRERSRTKQKLDKDKPLREYVIAQLREDYSPEQIVGRLKTNPPRHLNNHTICAETIYQYIYEGEGRYQQLYPHLRRGKKKRQKQRARKPRKTKIKERVSIHERPQIVEEKQRFGDWESDSMVCKKQKEILSVQYERKSQLVRIQKLPNKTAEATKAALRETITSLPQDLFQTMTFDNGTEGARHMDIRDDFNIQTYFCDAYASWQKGGVENINGLIRQYIPKNADLSKMSDEDIYAIQEQLNNRPRKGLNYLTPNEVIAMEVGH